MSTPGEKFRAALAAESPLQIAGAINAYLSAEALAKADAADFFA